jgi:hypothetical protein
MRRLACSGGLWWTRVDWRILLSGRSRSCALRPFHAGAVPLSAFPAQ